jgi:hypothetical protein
MADWSATQSNLGPQFLVVLSGMAPPLLHNSEAEDRGQIL